MNIGVLSLYNNEHTKSQFLETQILKRQTVYFRIKYINALFTFIIYRNVNHEVTYFQLATLCHVLLHSLVLSSRSCFFLDIQIYNLEEKI